HAAVIPHRQSELAMQLVDGLMTLDAKQSLRCSVHVFQCFLKGWMISRNPVAPPCVGEVVADGIGNHKVAVGKPLHECAGTEPVGPMVGKVSLAERVQPWNGGGKVVVNP